MQRLPEPLTTFRQIVESDLRRGARRILAVQDELDPQFRMATPTGDYHLAVTLPTNEQARLKLMGAIGRLMTLHQCIAFVLTTELVEPDAVAAIGVSKLEVCACLARIRREPRPWTAASFGAVEWLPRDQITPGVEQLLPSGMATLTHAELDELEMLFGNGGRFPLVKIPSRACAGLKRNEPVPGARARGR